MQKYQISKIKISRRSELPELALFDLAFFVFVFHLTFISIKGLNRPIIIRKKRIEMYVRGPCSEVGLVGVSYRIHPRGFEFESRGRPEISQLNNG
jgi:hypothetical protein